MKKQKRSIAIALACFLLLCAVFVSNYLLSLSKPLANRFPTQEPLASFENFHVIAHDLDETEDLNAECKAQLGEGVRLADWNDIVAYYQEGRSLKDFILNLKMSFREDTRYLIEEIVQLQNNLKLSGTDQTSGPDTLTYKFRISRDGQPRWDNSERHYFVGRHDHFLPPGFLDHDDLNNYQLTLGSWYGKGGYALCYAEPSEISTGAPLISFERFHVIAHDLDEMGDFDAECKAQLGEGVRLADWNDIVAYYQEGGSLEDFISGLKMSLRDDMLDLFQQISQLQNNLKSSGTDQASGPDTIANQYRISRDGQPRWGNSQRHYFVGRHDHFKPPDFLDHDNLNNYQLTLGSWGGKGGYALCYGDLIGMPISVSKTLKSITPFAIILLVCIVVLCAVLASVHVLNMPRWLFGSNTTTLKQADEE